MYQALEPADLSRLEGAGYICGAMVRAKVNLFQQFGGEHAKDGTGSWRTAKIVKLISHEEVHHVLLEGCEGPVPVYDTYPWNAESRSLRLSAAREFAGQFVRGWVYRIFISTKEQDEFVDDLSAEDFEASPARQADEFVCAALTADLDVLS